MAQNFSSHPDVCIHGFEQRLTLHQATMFYTCLNSKPMHSTAIMKDDVYPPSVPC